MLNFFLLTAFAIFIFRVPFTGSFFAFTGAALLYVICALTETRLLPAKAQRYIEFLRDRLKQA